MEFRHELKYIINYADYALIRIRLEALMQRDSHANADGCYTIRSLYFDDYMNSAYNDKYFGILDRQKYRIRIYNFSDSFIQLERKIKKDRYVYKQSAPLTRCQVEEILRGNYDVLRGCDDPLHTVFYHECRSKVLRPRLIVDYEREPFVLDAGTVRITFDRNVRVGIDGWDIFDPHIATMELLEPQFLVMEVKYTEFLPALIQCMLPRSSAEYTAVSKYVMSCDQTMYKRMADR
jgi:hypothetical protein